MVAARGTVRQITFDIEYPDGSTKTSTITNAGTLESIEFRSDEPTFTASEDDWEQNPTMLVFASGETRGGGGGIPFCTHNGCSQLDV